jgi:hypothetical protein
MNERVNRNALSCAVLTLAVATPVFATSTSVKRRAA